MATLEPSDNGDFNFNKFLKERLAQENWEDPTNRPEESLAPEKDDSPSYGRVPDKAQQELAAAVSKLPLEKSLAYHEWCLSIEKMSLEQAKFFLKHVICTNMHKDTVMRNLFRVDGTEY